MTNSVVGLRSSSKALPNTKLAPKSLIGGLLPVQSATALWIPMKPLPLRSILSKSMRCTKNYNACSWHLSTERAQLFFMLHQTKYPKTSTSKDERIGLWSFASPAILTWLLTNWLSILQTSRQLFCRKNASTILESRMQKVLSKSSLNLKLNFLCYRNKQIYFSLAKMCWL